MEGLFLDYDLSHHATEGDDGGNVWNKTRQFKTMIGVIADAEQFAKSRTDMTRYDDDWREIKLDQVLKRAGIATGLGLSVIALIMGLALELKRSGNDIINAGVKPKPIKPGEKTKKGKPWREIEDIARKTTGHGLIFMGDHVHVVIGVSLLYLWTRRK